MPENVEIDEARQSGAEIQDLLVPKGRRFVPLLEILSGLLEAGVCGRLLHTKERGPRLWADFDKVPNLISSYLFERHSLPPDPRRQSS